MVVTTEAIIDDRWKEKTARVRKSGKHVGVTTMRRSIIPRFTFGPPRLRKLEPTPHGPLPYVDVGGEESDNVVEPPGGSMIRDSRPTDGGAFHSVLLLIGTRESMLSIIEWPSNSSTMMDPLSLGFVWVPHGDSTTPSPGPDQTRLD